MKKIMWITILVTILLVGSGLVLSIEKFKIISKPITEAVEDETYQYDVEVYSPNNAPVRERVMADIEENVPAAEPLKITFRLLAAPEKMSIDENTGLITWTPMNDDALPGQNQHEVVVEAQDSKGNRDRQSFTITVKNINDAPEIQELPEITLSKNEPFTLNLNEYITDIDNPLEELKLDISGQEKVAIELADNVATFSIDNYWYGADSAVLKVSDAELSDEAELKITVEKTIPRPPIGEGMPELILNEEANVPAAIPRLGATQVQTIELVEGWNLISLAVKPENQSIANVLSSIQGQYDVVEALVYTPQGLEWKVYIPGWPPGANTLRYLDETTGIYIKMREDATLTVTGQAIESTTIELDKGWNLIGFPSLTNNDVVLATENIEPRLIAIFEYEPRLEQPWKYYNPNVPPFVSNLHSLKEGYGYWINVNSRMRLSYENGIFKIEEVDDTQEPGEYTYVYAGNERLIKIDKETDEEFYYHYDHLGNTRMITDEAGQTVWKQDYYPFGKQLRSQGENNSFKFGAKEYDYETELSNFGARYYDSELGRFIQVDPKFKAEQSPYSYAANNPFGLIDPTGMTEVRPTFEDKLYDSLNSYIREHFGLQEDDTMYIAFFLGFGSGERPSAEEYDAAEALAEGIEQKGRELGIPVQVDIFAAYVGGDRGGRNSIVDNLLQFGGLYTGLREDWLLDNVVGFDRDKYRAFMAYSGGRLIAEYLAGYGDRVLAISSGPGYPGSMTNTEIIGNEVLSKATSFFDRNSDITDANGPSGHGLSRKVVEYILESWAVEWLLTGRRTDVPSKGSWIGVEIINGHQNPDSPYYWPDNPTREQINEMEWSYGVCLRCYW
jgi:RHS repeat-associated protein